jgi:uncharacterized membrane protein YeaQ/YmgE (transglycosylase-associated protein family)
MEARGAIGNFRTSSYSDPGGNLDSMERRISLFGCLGPIGPTLASHAPYPRQENHMVARRTSIVSFVLAIAGLVSLSVIACGTALAQDVPSQPDPVVSSSFLQFAKGMVAEIELQELVVWLIVGAVAGTFAAGIVTCRRDGFGGFTNLAIGLVGALLGGLVFQLLRWNVALGAITIHYDDLAAALFGSMLLLMCAWWLRVRWNPKRRKA